MKNVANRLVQLRLKTGYTNVDVAKAIGVTPATYAKFEKGEGVIRSGHVARLALLYEVSCDYICCRDESEMGSSSVSSHLIEDKLSYDAWYCGHWHINKRIDKMHFLMECHEILK